MRGVMPLPRSVLFAILFTVAAASIYGRAESQVTQPASTSPRVELVPAPALKLPGNVDSNSPAVWQLVAGRWFLHVLTSVAGSPSYSWGGSLTTLSSPRTVEITPWPGEGVWMEAIVPDVDGTWYGYYHNERVAEQQCPQTDKVIPRIGAARSADRGATWVDLGIIIEAPPGTYDCSTSNHYFVGGIGDPSVMLDPDSRDLYVFYSQYVKAARWQGVTIARLAWADRDNPVGKVMVWRGGIWVPARKLRASGDTDTQPKWLYPLATPVLPAGESWHDGDDEVDAFWGPSVHWNTHLQLYVMLLNHARNAEFGQEGIYVSFAPKLDDPRLWSKPVKILDGGGWYPEAIGLETAVGTGKLSGEWARFFMSGTSRHYIRFIQ